MGNSSTYLLCFTDTDSAASDVSFEDAWKIMVAHSHWLGRVFLRFEVFYLAEDLQQRSALRYYGKFVELQWSRESKQTIMNSLRPYCYHGATLAVVFTVEDPLGFCTKLGGLAGWQPEGGLLKGYPGWQDVEALSRLLDPRDVILSFCHDGDPIVLRLGDYPASHIESLLGVTGGAPSG